MKLITPQFEEIMKPYSLYSQEHIKKQTEYLKLKETYILYLAH